MATTVADIIRAESMIASSWPALNICLSGRWLLGMADGISGRANSLFFLDSSDDADYKARLDWMEKTYRKASLPPRARLSPLAPVAVIKELQNRGYTFKNPTITLRKNLAEQITSSQNNNIEIVTSTDYTDQWLDTFIKCSPRYKEYRRSIEKMLDAVLDETTYYLALSGDKPVATAMCVKHINCMTIQNVATLPDHQRQGHAHTIMEMALAQATQSKTDWCWLAVEQTNIPAISLYRNLGFEDFYSYIYASLEA